MATNPATCTHLIADHFARTEKFLCAMSHAPFILTKEWAIDSANAKRLLCEFRLVKSLPLWETNVFFFLAETEYLLVDKEGEAKFGFKLSEALRRARLAEKKLLEGHLFYITPKVLSEPNGELLKKVITSAGGKVGLFSSVA